MTLEERNEKQRVMRKKNGNAYTKKYEKTIRGFLMRMYRNMESRVTGIQKLKLHLYKGKRLLNRQRFYDWALMSSDFHRLFEQYERKNYDQKYAPSVDRIDSTKGYFLKNMEWVTHSENSRRGSAHALEIRRMKKHLLTA